MEKIPWWCKFHVWFTHIYREREIERSPTIHSYLGALRLGLVGRAMTFVVRCLGGLGLGRVALGSGGGRGRRRGGRSAGAGLVTRASGRGGRWQRLRLRLRLLLLLAAVACGQRWVVAIQTKIQLPDTLPIILYELCNWHSQFE